MDNIMTKELCDTRYANLNASILRVEKKTDIILSCLDGNGQLGLKTRIDRLETYQRMKRGERAMIRGTMLAAIFSLIVSLCLLAVDGFLGYVR